MPCTVAKTDGLIMSEQDPTEKTLFVVSMMHANTVKPTTRTSPAQEMLFTVTVYEVVHHEEISGHAQGD